MAFTITPINLPDDKKREIAQYLTRALDNAVKARTQQIDGDYERWLNNYNAIPEQEVRSTPFVGASNFIPQMIRIHTDILSARINGILCGTRPFWRPSTFMSGYKSESMRALADWMELTCRHRINFFPNIDTTISETCKTGTVILKGNWQETTRYGYKSAAAGETSMASFSQKTAKMQLTPVMFYDFFPYPITAPTLEQVQIKFQRLRFTREEVQYRIDSKQWDKVAGERILLGGSKLSTAETQLSDITNISLTPDVTRPFQVFEAWFEYALAPGQNYSLVATFNPAWGGKESIISLFANPLSDLSMDPFVDFRLYPRADLFYGDCIPNILEQSQEEQAHIHNSRRDANTIANVPAIKQKRYSNINNMPSSKWYPGKTYLVDNMDDVSIMEAGGNYNSMIEEENFILQLAERATGISAPMQGMGTGSAGKKGTYASQGTIALLSEGNRRLDVYLKRMRQPFQKLGKLIFTNYRDFSDINYDEWGKNGQLLKEIFAQSSGPTDDSHSEGTNELLFDFSASDAGANKETDRSSLLLMANTMSAYYNQIVSASQQLAGMPDGSPAKNITLAVLDGARDLAERILSAFDVHDRDSLLPDVRATFGGNPAGAQPGGEPQPGGPGNPAGPVPVNQLQNISARVAALGSRVPR